MIVFKLERERPAFSLFQDTLYYIRDKYVHQYDLNTRADVGVLSVRKLGGQYVQPRTLSFNPAERAIIVTSVCKAAHAKYEILTLLAQTADNGIYELVGLPRDVGSGELRDSSTDGKRGTGNSVVFVARNRFAVLEKATQVSAFRLVCSCLLTIESYRTSKFETCPTQSPKRSKPLCRPTKFSTAAQQA